MSGVIQNGNQKRALGRGLSALIPQAAPAPAPPPAQPVDLTRSVLKLPIETIERDGEQPRRHFDNAKLEELAHSIREQGVLQPILVRKVGANYRIIAGERRWRAAQLAGLKEVPALVREVTEKEAFELALVENLQRADLNPIEEAEGYRRLIEEFGLTQEQAAVRVGKDRSTVANALRLLSLPDEVKDMVGDGTLSMGHARALLGVPRLPEMARFAARVAAEKLSVRETERLVKQKRESDAGGAAKPATPAKTSPQARAVVEALQRDLGTKVRLVEKGGGKGTLEIDFFSYEDLDRLLASIRSKEGTRKNGG